MDRQLYCNVATKQKARGWIGRTSARNCLRDILVTGFCVLAGDGFVFYQFPCGNRLIRPLSFVQIKRPSCGKPRRNDGTLRRSAYSDPCRARRTELHTSRRCPRKVRRFAWRTGCCGQLHQRTTDRSPRIQCNRLDTHSHSPCRPCERNSCRTRLRSRYRSRCSTWHFGPDDDSSRVSIGWDREILANPERHLAGDAVSSCLLSNMCVRLLPMFTP